MKIKDIIKEINLKKGDKFYCIKSNSKGTHRMSFGFNATELYGQICLVKKSIEKLLIDSIQINKNDNIKKKVYRNGVE